MQLGLVANRGGSATDEACGVASGLAWDPVDAAGEYAAVAGVLAAVVFAGLVLILASYSPRQRSRQRVEPVSCLFVAFFGLTASAFAYAIISGEECGARAYLEARVAGSLFGSSGVLTFVGLAWLLTSHPAGTRHSIRVAATSAILAAVLVALFVTTAINDAAQALGDRAWTPGVSASAVLLATGIAVGSGLLVSKRLEPMRRWAGRSLSWTSLASLALLLATFHLVAVTTPPRLSGTTNWTSAWLTSALSAIVLGLAIAAVPVRWSRPAEVPS